MSFIKQNGHLVLILVFASLFYLVNLGERPLEDYDEATYASVLKNSFERSDFLSFQYFGQNWFEKPPLYFWLAAASAKVFGFDEFALRFPSALAGIVSVLLIYLISLALTQDRLAALFAGTILALTPFFTAATRNMRLDTPVTACVLGALYFYLTGLAKERRLMGIGISIGIGILFKSVIGLLAWPILLIWSVAIKRWGWLKNKFFWLGNLIGILIAAPWHVYESAKFGGAFWRDYLGYHVLSRFGDNILGSKITVGYYINSLWKLSQPVLLLVFVCLILLLFSIKNRPYIIAALASAFFIFILFSLSKTKLITYYTPLYPFVALASGLVYSGLKGSIRRRRWLVRLAAMAVVLTSVYSGGSEFFYPQIYVTRAAPDEKTIGLYLAQNHHSEEVNIFNWNHHNTVRYYSGRLTESLQFNTVRAPTIPSWLVIPSEVFKINKQLHPLPTPYQGEHLTLVHLVDKK